MIFTFGNCGKNRGKYHYLPGYVQAVTNQTAKLGFRPAKVLSSFKQHKYSRKFAIVSTSCGLLIISPIALKQPLLLGQAKACWHMMCFTAGKQQDLKQYTRQLNGHVRGLKFVC